MSATTPVKRDLKTAEISPNPPDRKQQNLSMEDILSKLDSTVSALSTEVKDLRESNTTLNSTVTRLENKITKLSTKLEASENAFTAETSGLSTMKDKMCVIEKENCMLKRYLSDITEKITDLEYHQKRNNLIFDGFPEHKGETDINIFNRLMECLSTIIDVTGIKVARCHRLGQKKNGVNRPIIANFPWYGDVNTILNSKMHLPKGIYVKTDIPKIWDERMRVLRPMYREIYAATSDKSSVKLTKGKLIVNKKVYLPDDVEELKKDYPNANPCEKESDDKVIYFGLMSIYSNMYPATFTLDGQEFSSTEQYLQSKKASLFDDDQSEAKILNTQSPYEAKRIGNNIKNFNEQKWQSSAFDIAVRGVYEKFHQNTVLGDRLLASNKQIHESSLDRYWGTGIHLKSSQALDVQNWHGEGLMSRILDAVREMLKNDLADIT